MQNDIDKIEIAREMGRISQALEYLMMRSAEDKDAHIRIDNDLRNLTSNVAEMRASMEGLEARLSLIERWKEQVSFGQMNPRMKIVITLGSVGGATALLSLILPYIFKFIT